LANNGFALAEIPLIFQLANSYFYTYSKSRNMATTKKLIDFVKNTLNNKESEAVKGGKAYIPTDTGSVGYINWDDIDVREDDYGISPSNKLNFGLFGKQK